MMAYMSQASGQETLPSPGAAAAAAPAWRMPVAVASAAGRDSHVCSRRHSAAMMPLPNTCCSAAAPSIWQPVTSKRCRQSKVVKAGWRLK